jgi:hypothetical protein
MAKSHRPGTFAGLSADSKRLFRGVTRGQNLSPGRRALLLAALTHRDRAAVLAERIDAEGATFTTKKTGAVHVHPAYAVQQREQQRFEALWLRMHLEFEPDIDGLIYGPEGDEDDAGATFDEESEQD